MNNSAVNEIKEEIMLLEEEGDCFGYDFGNGKGVFVLLVDYSEGVEYMIEKNAVHEDGEFEPYGECNESCAFGNVDEAIEIIKRIYEDDKPAI